MSNETLEYLRQNILVGFAEKRGRAWWSRKVDENGGPANHFPGAIPLETVLDRQYGWEYEAVRVWTGDRDPLEEAEGWQAIRRTDNHHVFAFPTSGYRIHNRRDWCLKLVSEITDTAAGDLGIAGAGVLRNGAQCYVQFELPENVQANGEELRPFILAATSGDGSIRSVVKTGVTRVVCDNTLAAGLAEKGNAFRVKHTSNSEVKLSEARDALGILHKASEDFIREMDQLMNTPVSDAEWGKIVAQMIPELHKAKTERSKTMAENRAARLLHLYNNDMRVAPWRDTAWGVTQAFSTYSQHESTVRSFSSRFERTMVNAVGTRLEAEDGQVRAALAKVLVKS